MSLNLKFLGAAGCVTGSKYLLTFNDKKILIDAGMFQGSRELRQKNWKDPEVPLSEIDAVILTHAHIDHTGILPRYYALGLKCPVYASNATVDLCEILLPDAGYLQEEEAEYRRKNKQSRHNPPLPLFTFEDAKACLDLFERVKFDRETEIVPGLKVKFSRAGHIIGAAHLTVEAGDKTITFSGDIGRYDMPILVNPSPVEFGDLLLIESTYGNRGHDEGDPKKILEESINRTYNRGGVVVIPSFAVGRAQLLLYYIRELKEEKRIPDLPVFIDSPMACDATEVYRNNPKDYDEETLGILRDGNMPFYCSKFACITDSSASKKLNQIDEPMVIISASGMLYGGRILHHLKHRIEDKRNTVIFVGYQPPGSRGDQIQKGAKYVRLIGHDSKVNAEIITIGGLSAHADREELLRWCKSCKGKPGRVAVVHGEPQSASDFKNTLTKKFGWDVFVAGYLENIEI